MTHFSPIPIGHGGYHRSYQIYKNLVDLVGEQNIIELSYEKWQQGLYNRQNSSGKVRKNLIRNRTVRKWITYKKNPLKIICNNTSFSPYRYIYPDFIEMYKNKISSHEDISICIIEHPGFLKIAETNDKVGISTICISHNLESFDTASAYPTQTTFEQFSTIIDFMSELEVYGKCSQIFSISKIEAGLLSGLGLPAQYYPYFPVGDIRERLIEIRKKREEQKEQKRFFLLMGSASHTTTQEGMLWFLEHLTSSNIISKVQLIVVGKGTEKFSDKFPTWENIEFKGFVNQAELETLMENTIAVIIPQFRGFGTITRISESSCAGVPVICTKHPTLALDVPPGVYSLSNQWITWQDTLSKFMVDTLPVSNLDLYENWEKLENNIITDSLSSFFTRK